jgi:hypothetical protein
VKQGETDFASYCNCQQMEALFVLVPVSKRPHLARDILSAYEWRLRVLLAYDSAERLQLLLPIIVVLLSRRLSLCTVDRPDQSALFHRIDSPALT